MNRVEKSLIRDLLAQGIIPVPPEETDYIATIANTMIRERNAPLPTEEHDVDHINPKYYQALVTPEDYEKFPDGMSYMDLMTVLLRDYSGVTAHLLGQMYKYMLRFGKKDSAKQEAGKIAWYANYLEKETKE